MNLKNKHIAIVSSFEAPYGGNFIKMLTALGKRLRIEGAEPFYIFPIQSKKGYLDDLTEEFTVGYTRKPYSKCMPDLYDYFEKWNIDLIHVHFEAYDIPAAKAIRKIGRDIKMVWHLHDNITLNKEGLNFKCFRKIATHFRFWYHWGWLGRNAYFIPVSQEVGVIENHYRKHFFSFPPEDVSVDKLNAIKLIRGEVVINGIDLSRIFKDTIYSIPEGQFQFLTFGGHTKRKGIPTILSASELLVKENLDFHLNITKGVGTEEYVKTRYSHVPEWLTLIEQSEDVCSLLDKNSCFISAATKETMSMAIAEASIYGLPVIQSGIPGTWWNADSPSTFLFKVNDAEDLARQMKAVMDMDRNELMTLCRKTSKINKENLSMDRWVSKIISIYEKV